MKTHTTFLFTLLLTAALIRPSFADVSLEIENLWIAEAPPVSKVLAGYMHIKNTSDKDRKLISATSENFSSIEFHRSIEHDGMASMQRQSSLLIPAGGSLTLEPGNYHLMLFNPNKKLRAGDSTDILFTFENGNTITSTAIVKKSTIDHSDHDHH